MRLVRDEDGSFLVLGRGGCGCGLDFGTKIVGGGRGLGSSVTACLCPGVSQKRAQDAEVERAGALLVCRCVPKVEGIDMRCFVSYVLPYVRRQRQVVTNGSLRCGNGGLMGGKSSGTHASSRELEPEDENGLESVVEGEVVKENAEGKRLDEIEEAKDDPVRQPLDIIFMPGRLERAEAEVGWESPANEVRGGGGEGVDKDEEGAEDGAAEDQRRLGDLHAGLDVIEHRVARQLEQPRHAKAWSAQHTTGKFWKNGAYLFVELGVVVPGLGRGLDVDGVAGDRLRGHDARNSGRSQRSSGTTSASGMMTARPRK